MRYGVECGRDDGRDSTAPDGLVPNSAGDFHAETKARANIEVIADELDLEYRRIVPGVELRHASRDNGVSMLSRARIEGRARPPRGVNPYIRAPAPTCTYDGRTSRPIPTSPPVSVRTDRGATVPARDSDGRARANPASGQSLHLPSALYDAHPLWRTQKIWTVIDIEVVSQHANAADVTTAQRGVPLQALQARAPTTIRPAAVDPLTAPRVATFGQIPVVVVRSATALRARP